MGNQPEHWLQRSGLPFWDGLVSATKPSHSKFQNSTAQYAKDLVN